MYLGFRQLAALTVEAQAMDREAFRINGGKHVQIIQEAANTAIRTLKDKINTSRKCG
jgi:hypothetical protein